MELRSRTRNADSRNPVLMVVLLSLASAGCTTGYQPLAFKGGYVDRQLSDTTYSVTFSGNGYTSRKKVYACFLRRCSELTAATQNDYFTIENYEDFLALAGQPGGNSIQGTIAVHKGVRPPEDPAAFDKSKIRALPDRCE
jgi:hypothetical protein